jgi:hypothetical protein
MDRSKDGKDFYEILKARNPHLASFVEDLREKGLEDWVHLLMPELGSHAGYPHLRNVERIANRIVPDHMKEDFSDGEIFLLLSSIFLHDIGKTSPPPTTPTTLCNLDPKTCQTCSEGEAPPCYKPFWDHYKLGEEIILDQGVALGLPDERIAQYCGLLVFCHGLREPPIKDQPIFVGKDGKKCVEEWLRRGDYRTTSLAPYGVIRIPLLASILRIADETDDSWTRALRDYWIKLRQQKSANVGKAFRRCIEDIEFCHTGHCLIMHVPEMDDTDASKRIKVSEIRSIDKVRKDISLVLMNWKDELTKIGVQFDEVYIEYRNHLYKEFISGSDGLTHQSLSKVVGGKNMKSIEKMLDAMIQLSLGSCEFSRFTWEMLEAQVGQPLTAVDKWLAGRIADASDNHIQILEQGELCLSISREEAIEIKNRILHS